MNAAWIIVPKKASIPISATVPFTLAMMVAFKLLIGEMISPIKNKIIIKNTYSLDLNSVWSVLKFIFTGSDFGAAVVETAFASGN